MATTKHHSKRTTYIPSSFSQRDGDELPAPSTAVTRRSEVGANGLLALAAAASTTGGEAEHSSTRPPSTFPSTLHHNSNSSNAPFYSCNGAAPVTGPVGLNPVRLSQFDKVDTRLAPDVSWYQHHYQRMLQSANTMFPNPTTYQQHQHQQQQQQEDEDGKLAIPFLLNPSAELRYQRERREAATASLRPDHARQHFFPIDATAPASYASASSSSPSRQPLRLVAAAALTPLDTSDLPPPRSPCSSSPSPMALSSSNSSRGSRSWDFEELRGAEHDEVQGPLTLHPMARRNNVPHGPSPGPSSSAEDDEDEDSSGSETKGRRDKDLRPIGTIKKRRASQQQVSVLEQFFANDPLPSSASQRALAEAVGMSQRSVQLWFQNKRAKLRRLGKTIQPKQKGVTFHHFAVANNGKLRMVNEEAKPDLQGLF